MTSPAHTPPMSTIETKRALMGHAKLLTTSNDPEVMMESALGLMEEIGALMSDLTGETIRMMITADGYGDLTKLSGDEPTKH